MSNNKYTLGELTWIALILLLPIAYLAYVYPSLPETVATHFDLEGHPNGYNHKSTLWTEVLFLAGLSAGLYALTKHLPAIDPKKRTALSAANYRKTGFAVLTLFAAINLFSIYAAANPGFNISSILLAVLGLFFIYIGNQMHSMKPNYFIGIRVPWTLENEDNWRATHRIGSRLFMAGGLIITLSALLLPARVANICLMIVTALMVLIPCTYSFIYFKKHKQ